MRTAAAGSPWKNPLKGWYNKPAKKVVIKDSKIIVKVPERTDCWRKTRQGLLTRTVNNAPFHWQKVTAPHFQAIVHINGTFDHDYDKAGLMVRLDEEHWIFTGMEYVGDRVHHATSVANDASDWSIAPLPENAEKAGVWFCLKRMEDSYDPHSTGDVFRHDQSALRGRGLCLSGREGVPCYL
jgi:uncharacterized protein